MSNESEYLVMRDYHNEEFDFDLVEGDVISEESFDEESVVMLDRLVGRGILQSTEIETVERVEDDNLNDGQ